MYTTKFKITNLDCEACIKLSIRVLKKIHGVIGVKVDLKSGEAELITEHEIAWDQIFSALQSVGKQAVNN